MAGILLATLNAFTELQLREEQTQTDGTAWQRVRTIDGCEGWVIASAIE